MARTSLEPTPEIIGDFDRRTALRLSLGLVVFIVVANAVALGLLRWRPINRGNWLVEAKWHLLDRTPAVETLVLGDSSCNQGVDPAVLDEALHTRSLNLCTVGNMLVVNDAWMLDEYIARHGAPKRVIVVHVYDVWTRPADYTFMRLVAKIPRPWGFWKNVKPSLDPSISDIEDLVSSRWLPLHSESSSLLTWLLHPSGAMHTHFAIDDHGFMHVAKAEPAHVSANLKHHLRELAEIPAGPTELNIKALRRLDELARQHHIDMTIALAPMFEGLWAEPAIQAHVSSLVASIRIQLGSGSPVRVIDTPPRTFAASQMENVDHVVGDAAATYTRWLADMVKGRP
jgi:hypothetical protein